MTRQFITWPKTADAAFRTAYAAKTGEYVQDNPLESSDDLSYMISTTSATQQEVNELKADTGIAPAGDVKSRPGLPPIGWIAKTVPE